MKRLSLMLVILLLALTACSPGTIATPQSLATATPEAPVPPTPVTLRDDLTPAQRAAIQQLAGSLGLQVQDVALVSTEAVTWPNGCLGVQRIGVLCTKNAVPGYRIVLQAGGKQYEYHTNLDGSSVLPAEAAQTAGSAEQVAIQQLATNLGIPVGGVQILSSSPVEWPDSCLGVALEGVMCAQVVTPGYLVVLEAAGRQYEYHTNQDASLIMPATLAMAWKQQGGIAGVCQGLTVYLSGEVYAMDCRVGGDQRMGVLTTPQRNKLHAWIDRFSTITMNLSDPSGVADGMTRIADLSGKGSAQASPDDQRAIFSFGQSVYQETYP